MTLKVKKLHPDAMLPTRGNPGDAGLDMYALEDIVLIASTVPVKVRTGIAMEIPPGYFGSARNRSGLSAQGIWLGGGVIDSTYRGEVMGIMEFIAPDTYNGGLWSKAAYRIKRGDRIFQVIIQQYIECEIEEVEELSVTERGAAGFGSTGR